MKAVAMGVAVVMEAASILQAAEGQAQKGPVFRAPDAWAYSAPLIAPEKRDAWPSRAQKDPAVVFHAGVWHVFMTVKRPGRSAIEACSFSAWGPPRC